MKKYKTILTHQNVPHFHKNSETANWKPKTAVESAVSKCYNLNVHDLYALHTNGLYQQSCVPCNQVIFTGPPIQGKITPSLTLVMYQLRIFILWGTVLQQTSLVYLLWYETITVSTFFLGTSCRVKQFSSAC